jgi:hypothetical protein
LRRGTQPEPETQAEMQQLDPATPGWGAAAPQVNDRSFPHPCT